jgi:hypothetical protein
MKKKYTVSETTLPVPMLVKKYEWNISIKELETILNNYIREELKKEKISWENKDIKINITPDAHWNEQEFYGLTINVIIPIK